MGNKNRVDKILSKASEEEKKKAEVILNKISEKTGEDIDRLWDAVADKVGDSDSLISIQGAALILANDRGVKLPRHTFQENITKIADLDIDMVEADIVGRVLRIYEPRKFQRRNGGIGRVQNILIGDATGVIRVSVWNKTIDSLQQQNLSVGDVVKIIRGILKEGFRDSSVLEMTIGPRSRFIIRPEGVDIPEIKEDFAYLEAPRVDICDIEKYLHNLVEIRGTILRIFENRPYYNICPECGKSLLADKNICPEHGDVSPAAALKLSGIIDDGTAAVRFVVFRGGVEKLTGLFSRDIVERYNVQPEGFFNELKGIVIGKDVVLSGRVKKNDLYENFEIMVNDVSEVDYRKEIIEIIEELEKSEK